MAHNRAKYTAQDEWGNELEISASFWRDEDAPGLHSIITVGTGLAHMQISATTADLRALATMFTERATALEAARVQFDADIEAAAAEQGFDLTC